VADIADGRQAQHAQMGWRRVKWEGHLVYVRQV